MHVVTILERTHEVHDDNDMDVLRVQVDDEPENTIKIQTTGQFGTPDRDELGYIICQNGSHVLPVYEDENGELQHAKEDPNNPWSRSDPTIDSLLRVIAAQMGCSEGDIRVRT